MNRREFCQSVGLVILAPRLMACGAQDVPSTLGPSRDDRIDVVPLRLALERMYGDRVAFRYGRYDDAEGTVVYRPHGQFQDDGLPRVCEEFAVNGYFVNGRVPPGFVGPVNVDTVMVRWDPVLDQSIDQIELFPRCG